MKILSEQQEKGLQLHEELVRKARENAAFKERLIAYPKQVINEMAGNSLPIFENKNVVVEDQTNENVIFLNIPAQPNLDELELTEEELDQVAGGWTFMYTVGISLVGLAIKGFQDGQAAGAAAN